MAWFLLLLAGVFEAGWVISLQKSESFSRTIYVILASLSMIISLVLFSISLKHIAINHAYIVWLAFGASSLSIINTFYFAQPFTILHGLCLGLIILGVIGLKLLA